MPKNFTSFVTDMLQLFIVSRDAHVYQHNLLSGFIWIINYLFTIRIRHLVIFNKRSIKFYF